MKDRDNQAANLRQMANEQLSALLRETCTNLFKMRMLRQSDRLDVPSEIKRNRRLIARIKTIQGERSRGTVTSPGV